MTKMNPKSEVNMRKNILVKAIAALLVFLLIPACAGLAEKAYVISSTTAYSKPDTSSKSYGEIEAGAKVKLVVEQDGWAKIKKNGKVAFVDADDLAEIKTYNGKTMYMKEDAALLKNFSGSKVVKQLSAGDEVKLYATSGGWACIKSGGKSGFVKEDALTSEKPGTDTYTAYAAIDGAKLYKKNSTSSKVLERLDVNTQVTVLAVKGSWCRVKHGSVTGYMKKSALSESEVEVPVEDTFTAYVANDGAKVYKKCATSSKVLATLKLDTEITVTAYTDTWCRVKNNGAEAYMLRSDLSSRKSTEPEPQPEPAPGDSNATPASGTAKEMDWWTSDISTIFAVGTVAVITDVDTGIAWNEKRMGGTNHADVQPVTAADTAAMKKACGSWSWERRAIFVTINGVNYAASMNCMPHGSDSISGNDFDGHHCIHFTNSRTHSSNKVCALHQAAIKKALAAKL